MKHWIVLATLVGIGPGEPVDAASWPTTSSPCWTGIHEASSLGALSSGG